MSGTLIRIGADGTHGETAWTKSKPPDLKTLQAQIDGGYIERVKVRWHEVIRDAYVDEDGLSKNLPPNRRAMTLTIHTHTIVGPMVIWVPHPKPKKS